MHSPQPLCSLCGQRPSVLGGTIRGYVERERSRERVRRAKKTRQRIMEYCAADLYGQYAHIENE